ncbi:hypothetical protein [Caenibius sp. WL]|uniref:hypothetical protein n=1 Tax=Caenibius sp. WL TaxID=2872646 RepID=UPI001C997E89|nr:hypothetical protein [Caenibius sp. WL]QZP08190.1 hypothetical protein K5X80_16415 [Caenibius sp. WL]
MARKRLQADQRADLRGGKFIGLPTVVHKSEAYRSLPVFERAVLTEMLATFNGYNNGKLVVSHRQLAAALGNSNFGRISRAIAALIEHGLLDIATESLWKQRRAREYRLTFINTGSPPYVRPATNEYLSWRKNDADDVSAETPQSADDVSARSVSAADDVSATAGAEPQNCVGGPISSADDVSALISKPYLGPRKRDDQQPKQALPVAAAILGRSGPAPMKVMDWSGPPEEVLAARIAAGGEIAERLAAMPREQALARIAKEQARRNREQAARDRRRT